MRENEINRNFLNKLPENYFYINEKTDYKVFFGVLYTTKFNAIYQNIQNKTLLHEEKLRRNKKELKKSKIAGKFVGSFVGSMKFCSPTKFRNPCKIGKVATTSAAFAFAFFYAL